MVPNDVKKVKGSAHLQEKTKGGYRELHTNQSDLYTWKDY